MRLRTCRILRQDCNSKQPKYTTPCLAFTTFTLRYRRCFCAARSTALRRCSLAHYSLLQPAHHTLSSIQPSFERTWRAVPSHLHQLGANTTGGGPSPERLLPLPLAGKTPYRANCWRQRLPLRRTRLRGSLPLDWATMVWTGVVAAR